MVEEFPPEFLTGFLKSRFYTWDWLESCDNWFPYFLLKFTLFPPDEKEQIKENVQAWVLYQSSSGRVGRPKGLSDNLPNTIGFLYLQVPYL